ncbi:MAG: inositol monophosphatase [Candidatus Aminicenantes bacterium]|nr:inositol monophosphatase [Candidatus Aminicenantes bacterium]
MIWDECLKAAVDASMNAGRMLRTSIGRSRQISYKGAVDLVTDCDKRSQHMISESLSSLFPEHDFLAEEDLCEDKGSEFRWIVDPIDGTTNYAHNFPVFCISIALEWKGKMVLGVVYDPMREELFSAVTGKGARLNKKSICVSTVNDLDKSLLATGFPYDLRESRENNLNHFSNFAVRAQAVRRCGSAALDLCYVACGRFDGFWELKLSPWDMAAGALIVREAGGRVTDFADAGFDLFGPEILATNRLIHMQMIAVLGRSNVRK